MSETAQDPTVTEQSTSGGRPSAADEGKPTPEPILQLGHAFEGSKTLLSAVELGVFEALAHGPLDSETLRQRLGLHPRSATDFFDALVALGHAQP